MKLHLNLSLRRALLAVIAATTLPGTAWAGTMHSDATVQTYADFGQNRGRYVVGDKVNALLDHIRTHVDKGIAIPYTDRETPYIISNEQGMINFSGTADAGYAAMIGPTYMATVLHNGSLNGSFSERTIGSGHALNYEAIDIRNSDVFRLAPDNWGGGQYDYMLQRQSKVVTDVTWNPLTTMSSEQIGNLGGSLLYHSGSGTKYMWNDEKKDATHLTGAYGYIIGSINTISSGQLHSGATAEDGTNFSLHINPDLYSGSGANEKYPLPLGAKPGDSGSPTFIYNSATGQYEYIAAVQSAGIASNNTYSQARGNVEWTALAMEQLNERVQMSGTDTVYLNAINTAGETISDTVGDTLYQTTLYTGNATDAQGNVLATYTGVKSGTNTWKNLGDRKNYDNWYCRQNTTTPDLLGRYQVISDLNVSDADLFFTENLVFTPSQANNNIILNATVDLGIGYAEFNKGENMDKAVFNITAATSGAMFNHAGYVVNQGAEVHVKLNNSADHMTEWRKIGAGDLYIDGTGDTNALLNVGGKGTTYLQQSGGHAAYNVLANSGATVVISNTSQIERDFTFGAGGGTLDMNGNSMEWYTSGGETREGSFTIHALTEEATITNTSSTGSISQVTLTYMQGGNTTFAGSFQDSATGALSIVYNGGGTWTLNSIRTNLTHISNSLFTVASGKVILSGTNTVHGLGSATGTNSTRYTSADDWHYADAAMDVSVENGSTFELGSHARLKGQVNVWNDSTFLLREGVKHQYEYVEGGATKENTYDYADFYGFHGKEPGNEYNQDIYLVKDTSALKVEYNKGTTANTTLAANIWGKGSVSIDTGLDGGTLTLSGNNKMSGTKTLIAGGLIATRAEALGNISTNKWKVQEKAWIASTGETGASLLSKIDTSSTGILALSEHTLDALDISKHAKLYIGAMAGTTVDYGTLGTTTALAANSEGKWLLGGGGGTLNVHFLLTGGNNLVIGNEYSSGTVHLTNTNNNFTGTISIMGTGNLLTYAEGALGNAHIDLSYGNSLALHDAKELDMLTRDAIGTLAAAKSIDLDLSGLDVSLGAADSQTYSGKLTVGDTYRFGGSGHLTLDTELTGAIPMEIDGQGNEGSSVTFARENAYTGDIVAGGGLKLATPNSTGSVGIHAGNANALAAVNSLQLQQGATLYTDGHAHMTVQNLSAESGAAITNNGEQASTLELLVSEGKQTSIANGVLCDSDTTLSLVKTGKGTLSMNQSADWSGGLTIQEGTVITTVNSSGNGVGAAGSSVVVESGAVLRLNMAGGTAHLLEHGVISQTITGTGTVEISSGKSVIFSQQKTGFEGTVKVLDNTRLYLGNMKNEYNNLAALDTATIEVESGSQVRITNSLGYMSDAAVTSQSDFIIEGTGFAGTDGQAYNNFVPHAHSDYNYGALAIDCGAVVTGNITLRDDATISSTSHSPQTKIAASNGYPYSTAAGYGVIGQLGGTIRGQIQGTKDTTLTLAGKEGLTFTADSANTYGDLIISNKNGNNTDKFALRLDGGKAVSQVSTALGTGKVTLGDGLILRLAGTSQANRADVVYTYANAITAGDNATLQSHNITNRLTDTVSMSNGGTLNLETAQGGALELLGGISGSGTVNIAESSKVTIGALTSTARTAQFTIEAGAGADITLNTPAAVSTSINGSDSLVLRLCGSDDYSFEGITLTGETTDLTLSFDFTQAPNVNDAGTWSTVNSDINADSTLVELSFNMFNDIKSGSYLLASGELAGSYTLADTLDDRLHLVREGNNLILEVDADERLYWSSASATQTWNGTDANWYQESSGSGMIAFSSGAHVVLDASGVAEGNSATDRETITLAENMAVSTMEVKGTGSHYEVNGSKSLSGDKMIIGLEGNLKLSNTAAGFTSGVLVNHATLEVSGTSLTADVSVENGASYTMSNQATLIGKLSISDATAHIHTATVNGDISTAGTGQLNMTDAMLGSHSIAFASGKSIQTNNAKVSGSLNWSENQAQVQLNGTLSAGSLNSTAGIKSENLALAAGTALHLSGSETSDIASISGVDSGYGSLYVTKGSTPTLNLGSATLNYASLRGGAANITGTVDVKGQLSIGQATLTIAEGASLIAKQLTAGNEADYSPSTIIIDGGTLEITGSTNNKKTTDSLLLAHYKWSNSSLKLLSGELKAKDAVMYTSWDSAGSFEALSGKATLKGINLYGQTSCTGTFKLGSQDSGSAVVTIGSEGISGIRDTATVELGNGTVAASADFSIKGSKAVTILGTAGGTIFDTATHTVTVETALTGSGKLVKSGAGSLELMGTGSDYSGSISVKEGSLVIGTNSAVGILGGLEVQDGATLDLSALTQSEDFTGLVVANGTTFQFGEKAIFEFGDLQAGTTYNIFDLTAGGQLDGWDSLTLDNFRMGGMNMSDLGRAEIQIGPEGSFSYTVTSLDLTWNGGSSGTWDFNTTAWQTTDASTGETTTTSFVNSDNVIFKTDTSIKVSENVAVNNLIIEKGASLSLSPADGASLLVQGAVNLGGTLSIDNYDLGTIKVDAGQEGTLEARTATINTLDVANGATLNLKNGVYTFTGDIGSAKSTGVVNFYGSAMKSIDGQNINVKGQLQIMGNTSVTINREGESVQDYTEGLHVYGTLSVEENAKLTMGGNGRTTLEEGGTILLKNGASMERSTPGSYWIAGSLKVAENATATFKTTDSIWMRSGGSIDVLRGATLNLGAVSFNSEDGQHDYNINIGNNATLNSTGTSMNLNGSASVNMAKGGRIQFTGVEYSNKGAAETATLKSGYVLTNGHATSTATNGITLGNKLVNSSVENAGGGTLRTTNTGNSITGVVASKGDVVLESMGSTLSLNQLEIGAGNVVEAYVGTSSETSTHVMLSGAALLSGTAALNTSLTLEAGSTLDMTGLEAGAVTVNGVLTFGGKVTMGSQLLALVDAMSGNESLTLFTGLDDVILPSVAETVTYDLIQASDVFSNVNNSHLFVKYQTSANGGSLMMMMQVPEPATSTLSLLALAALAARRRRK